MSDEVIARLAERQYGLVTRSQILGALSNDQLRRRIRNGRLVIARTGVYRLAGAPQSWEQHVLAACMVAHPRAVASFRTAATLWDFAGFDRPDVIEVTTPSRVRARIPDVTVHDSRVVGRRHSTRHLGIPITTPARTLCDLTACCSIWQVERAVDDAIRRRLTTVKQLAAVFKDLACRGRRRSTYIRAILEDRLPGFDPGESEQEAKLVRWLVDAGLPRPAQQVRVRVGNRNFRLDLAYPAHMLAIEYDGWDAHKPRTSFDHDRERDNALRLADWTVLHFTSKSNRSYVVNVVRSALRSRTPNM